ncbi:hypothetical protein DERF_003592 [Dermatophagoides farinae]|uniref:Uncharacterized protein n=1 Tax=Dermatophagoides farinae TaxID=6954 RepID=A0A922IF04_DERFA|nr:hypothetical protein DERF_003592 [Dermatophagoides farinae]
MKKTSKFKMNKEQKKCRHCNIISCHILLNEQKKIQNSVNANFKSINRNDETEKNESVTASRYV